MCCQLRFSKTQDRSATLTPLGLSPEGRVRSQISRVVAALHVSPLVWCGNLANDFHMICYVDIESSALVTDVAKDDLRIRVEHHLRYRHV